MSEDKFAEYDLPDEYAKEVEQLVGRLVLLYGQIDRLLIHALTRKSNPPIDLEKAIALVRENRGGTGVTLGAWFKKLDDIVESHTFPQGWIDKVKGHISTIRPMRDRLSHDTLMLSEEGVLQWKTNQSISPERSHKNFDIAELKAALEDMYAFKRFLFESS